MKSKPRRHTPGQKAVILREHLLDQRSVSELRQAYQLRPNVFCRWQKEFFEDGAVTLEKEFSAQLTRLHRQIDALQGQSAAELALKQARVQRTDARETIKAINRAYYHYDLNVEKSESRENAFGQEFIKKITADRGIGPVLQ